SPYQKGKRSQEIKRLKQDLMRVGFGTHWDNPTTLYGPDTEKVVREFQQEQGLIVNGIIDEVTLAKIDELLKKLSYTKYDLTLEEALNIQMKVKPQTDQNYAYVSAKH